MYLGISIMILANLSTLRTFFTQDPEDPTNLPVFPMEGSTGQLAALWLNVIFIGLMGFLQQFFLICKCSFGSH